MAEEKDLKKEKDKSEKIIYVLTGLLVLVVFGAIAILYFKPVDNKEFVKPETIQIAKVNEPKPVNSNQTINQTVPESGKAGEEKQSVKEQQGKQPQTIGEIIKQKSEEKASKEAKREEVKKEELQKQASQQNNVATNTEKKVKEVKKTEEVKKVEKPVKTEKKAEEVKKKEEKKAVAKVNQKKEVSKKTPVKKHTVKKYYYVQVSALASMEKANQVKSRYVRRGFKNVIIIKEKGFYKVLIGKFNSMKEANEFIRKHNIKGGWVRILKEVN
ncbi:MAG: hypothetical protein DSY66_03895 [Persephonella sp.]|nr:MAG: hypothetical protein DSY53_02795 [Persephonella sp.]RUM60775.1 MAG: hypothetical protein DSY66_03895 [Persephonella sp.]